MTELEGWLTLATRRLSKDSAALVRSEIQEHYESARESALAGGATEEQAARTALATLGEPQVANRQYRRVLLTSEEARILRESNWEARAVCKYPVAKWFLLSIPVAFLSAAVALLLTGGMSPITRVLLAAAIATSLVCVAPFLPIYTPSRARVYRAIKCIVLPSALFLAFGPDSRKLSWLLICCLWLLVHAETTRMSIRRKLPVAQWPKQLYL